MKFQISAGAHMVTSKFAQMAEYQKENMKSEKSQLDLLKQLDFSFTDFASIKKYTEEKGSKVLCTPFDMPSVYPYSGEHFGSHIDVLTFQ